MPIIRRDAMVVQSEAASKAGWVGFHRRRGDLCDEKQVSLRQLVCYRVLSTKVGDVIVELLTTESKLQKARCKRRISEFGNYQMPFLRNVKQRPEQ